ncbi:hypothetical protein R3W88_005199 [Solanum pinnatisectum]|uniref:peptidylprolyl isomerase n=1 Tax=Solanum pinnatisectum TaxID=50273 RepID=A0AAV9KBH4_9SOLN|nr:hypothetical protein R3W88_005199 [Solanum pinnatisectum]
MSVMIMTSLGDMVVDLSTDRCPVTCKNFLKLCKIKYYHNCLFHTVRKDSIMQTGDPARFFGDEMHTDLMGSSQFYITLPYCFWIGFDTLNRINETYVDDKGKPYQNIRIKHTYISYDPFQLADLIPDASPERKPKDEIDDDELGVREEKEAHSRAVILESVGDIPNNVLFVCKLKRKHYHKIGASHCYAFIEFEDKKSCEQAYFKMDSTLIDDRRIRVDFRVYQSYGPNIDPEPKVAVTVSIIVLLMPSNTKKKKKENKQHGGDGNSKYSKFLRT